MNIIFSCPAPNLDNGIYLATARSSGVVVSHISLLQTGGTKEDLFSSTQRSMSTISRPAMLRAENKRGRGPALEGRRSHYMHT